METIKEKQKKAFGAMKDDFGYKNILATPKIEKIVVSSGTGSKKNKGAGELISDRLSKITGQKPSACSAKKSIASFKLREGDIVGYKVTLRGQRMLTFLDKFINVTVPRTRDFKGYDEKIVDEMGNLTLAVRDHSVFPETSEEDLRDIFGLAVTITTTAKNREEALAFFKHIGIPFKKPKK